MAIKPDGVIMRGVSKDKRTGRWVAKRMVNGQRKYLGTFATVEEAQAAYDRAIPGTYISIYNKYLVTNEIGKRYSNKMRAFLIPMLEEAIEEGLNLRELDAELTQTVGAMIGEAVLTQSLKIKQREWKLQAEAEGRTPCKQCGYLKFSEGDFCDRACARRWREANE